MTKIKERKWGKTKLGKKTEVKESKRKDTEGLENEERREEKMSLEPHTQQGEERLGLKGLKNKTGKTQTTLKLF